ncbi:MAG TPA: AraC family transcriptional regulator [Kofleriaceae bacterium]|nr:AraC family transcriptional regulator [Kofleriaceae bacterium]
MDGVLTYSTSFCRILTDYLVAHGHPLDRVLAAMGVDEDALADRDGRIPRRAWLDAFVVAVEVTGDPDLGLRVGESIRPAHLGVLGYVLMSCESMRQAAELDQRWHSLIADGERLEYVRDGELGKRIQFLPPGEPPPPACAVACAAACSVSFVRWLAGADDGLRRVALPYPEPRSRAAHDAFFRCELVFDAPQITIWRDPSVLRKPLAQADPGLRLRMEERAARLAAERSAPDLLVTRVRDLVARGSRDALPDLETVAAGLAMSSRALKRRLADRGTSFTRIVDDTRRELALGYIADSSLTLVDVAYLCGFSEQSAFHRAFKRWTGLTPGEYRRR